MADEIAIKINMADDIICHLVQLEVYLLCQHILVNVMINFANGVIILKESKSFWSK